MPLDPAWEHGTMSNPPSRKMVRCIYCNKITTGGINRFKHHLAKLHGNVAGCPSVPEQVMKEMRAALENYKEEKQAVKNVNEQIAEERGTQEEDMLDRDMRAARKASQRTFFMEMEAQRIARDGAGPSSGPSRRSDADPSFAPRRRSDAGPFVAARSSDVGPSAIGPTGTGRGFRSASYHEVPTRTGTLDPLTFVPPSRQPTLGAAWGKDLKKKLGRVVGRLWYFAGLPFHAASNPYYRAAIETAQQVGPGVNPPTPYELGGPILDAEVEDVRQYVNDFKRIWDRSRCTIMADGWKDINGRTLINFLAYCPRGTVFLKCIDASSEQKNAKYLFKLFDKVVEEVGEKYVVQFVTDNAANYKAAGRLLMEKRKNLFWASCAAHCIDLMLEEIGDLPELKEWIEKGRKITKFIYNHSQVLNWMKHHTGQKDIIRPAVTRFATAYLSLSSINECQVGLKSLLASREWNGSRYAKLADGREVEQIITDRKFWENIQRIIKVTQPLVTVLRMVDSEERPAMGFIYEAIDRSKEEIQKLTKNLCKKLWDIIDKRWAAQLHHPLHAAGYYLNPIFQYGGRMSNHPEIMEGLLKCINRLEPSSSKRMNASIQIAEFRDVIGNFGSEDALRSKSAMDPAEWWSLHGTKHPELQRIAVILLSQTCSSSGCERNWSTFAHIHTKKRNRLAVKKMEKLVYVHYNLRLRERNVRSGPKGPIDLDIIFAEENAEEWLVEKEPPLLDVQASRRKEMECEESPTNEGGSSDSSDRHQHCINDEPSDNDDGDGDDGGDFAVYNEGVDEPNPDAHGHAAGHEYFVGSDDQHDYDDRDPYQHYTGDVDAYHLHGALEMDPNIGYTWQHNINTFGIFLEYSESNSIDNHNYTDQRIHQFPYSHYESGYDPHY
ncbi:uncharacterized protein LOC143887897 [Tasmannia lanceolata]|uniref:uncharacterized protein LOC143887897 n=1 Tax=Tasmannia lanceolata TaxID=3420 RepID=UPI004062A768